jgi:hypothetical protein
VDVGGWLRTLGLEHYEMAFRENGVSLNVLRHLTADDLRELGIGAVGHRRQLLVEIAELWDGAPQAVIPGEERALRFTRDETIDSKLDKLEALVVTHYGRPLSDIRFVASILSIPTEQRYGARPMTPQKRKDETLRTLVDLVEAAAGQHSSVLLFEDAHRADPTTLEVLDLLIDRVSSLRP